MSQPMKLVTIAAVSLAIAFSGCGDSGGSGDGGGRSPAERANDQAQREFLICKKQADQIAKQKGAEAASQHLGQCVENYANESQVEP